MAAFHQFFQSLKSHLDEEWTSYSCHAKSRFHFTLNRHQNRMFSTYISTICILTLLWGVSLKHSVHLLLLLLWRAHCGPNTPHVCPHLVCVCGGSQSLKVIAIFTHYLSHQSHKEARLGFNRCLCWRHLITSSAGTLSKRKTRRTWLL